MLVQLAELAVAYLKNSCTGVGHKAKECLSANPATEKEGLP